VDNMKHGQGVMTFEDGSEYNGAFEKDRMWNRVLSGDNTLKDNTLKDTTRV